MLRKKLKSTLSGKFYVLVISINSPRSLELSLSAFAQTLRSVSFPVALPIPLVPQPAPSSTLPAKMYLILFSFNTFLLRQPSQSFPHHLGDNDSQTPVFISRTVY